MSEATAAGAVHLVRVDTPRLPPRTNRTRRVPHPVLIGHAASPKRPPDLAPGGGGDGRRAGAGGSLSIRRAKIGSHEGARKILRSSRCAKAVKTGQNGSKQAKTGQSRRKQVEQGQSMSKTSNPMQPAPRGGRAWVQTSSACLSWPSAHGWSTPMTDTTCERARISPRFDRGLTAV